MAKKVLILKGSPREKGNSAVLAEQVAAGATEAGAAVESVYLHGLDIRSCDACDLCQEQGDGCVIEDDMQILYPKLEEADAILYVTIHANSFSSPEPNGVETIVDNTRAIDDDSWVLAELI